MVDPPNGITGTTGWQVLCQDLQLNFLHLVHYVFHCGQVDSAFVFQKGHRIRVDISSSNFPRFDVNPNTGEPLNGQRGQRVAWNTIYLDGDHASYILLPVIPAR